MNYEKIAEKWLKMCSDHRGEQIISLSELLGTVLNEALEVAAQRPVVIGAKPLCLDCHSAGITNCSHFDNCDGKWVYVAAPEPELTAEFFLHQREIDGPTMMSVEQLKGLLNDYALLRLTSPESTK